MFKCLFLLFQGDRGMPGLPGLDGERVSSLYIIIIKTSTIVPMQKISKPVGPNDFRPIVRPSLVMKCFESTVKTYIV